MVMNSLFSSHQIQTSGLCCLSVKEDIRFKIIENMSNIEDSILFMEKYYKTDIIFVIVKWEDRFINSVKFDIKVAIEEVGARVFFENQCKWESIETIADSIYCILR